MHEHTSSQTCSSLLNSSSSFSTASKHHPSGSAPTVKHPWGKPTDYSKSTPIWTPMTNPLQAAEIPTATSDLGGQACILFRGPACSNTPAAGWAALSVRHPFSHSTAHSCAPRAPHTQHSFQWMPFREENTLQHGGRVSLLDVLIMRPQDFSLVIFQWLLALQRKIKLNTEIIFWDLFVFESCVL